MNYFYNMLPIFKLLINVHDVILSEKNAFILLDFEIRQNQFWNC